MCSLGLGGNALSNPELIDFINCLRPSYKLPHRNTFNKLVEQEFNKTAFMVRQAVEDASFVAVCADGYTDIAHQHVYNVICLAPKPYLWTTVETTSDSETSSFLANLLKKEIEKIGKEKVVALITDHASNIRGAALQLQVDYPWLIVSGCKAHLLNLLARDICEKTVVINLIKDCAMITKFFRFVVNCLFIYQFPFLQAKRASSSVLGSTTRRWNNQKTINFCCTNKMVNLLRCF